MDRHEHVTIGVLAFIFGLITVAVGSITPDILEPATSWKHRGKCHSKRALKYILEISIVAVILGYVFIILADLSIFYIVSGFFLGYSLHLLADSTTPMGLPD